MKVIYLIILIICGILPAKVSTTIMDSYGKLSLNNNILVVMLPGDPGGYQKPLLKIYRLDENTKPSLILEQTNITNGFVQNNFLVTVLNDPDFEIYEVCLEPII